MYQNYNMYDSYSNYRNDYQINSDEIISLNEAINLIKVSVLNEKEDEIFYNNLINMAPTFKDKSIIQGIRDDEIKHNKILRELYYQFTGEILNEDTLSNNINNSINYKDSLEKALFGELNAVKKYRKIMRTMPSGDSYTLLMSIMTDELRHANEYNFLINNIK